MKYVSAWLTFNESLWGHLLRGSYKDLLLFFVYKKRKKKTYTLDWNQDDFELCIEPWRGTCALNENEGVNKNVKGNVAFLLELR